MQGGDTRVRGALADTPEMAPRLIILSILGLLRDLPMVANKQVTQGFKKHLFVRVCSRRVHM